MTDSNSLLFIVFTGLFLFLGIYKGKEGELMVINTYIKKKKKDLSSMSSISILRNEINKNELKAK